MLISTTLHIQCIYILYALPTDKEINIDQVIQQLQELTPHWRVVGKAVDIQPAVLDDVSAQCMKKRTIQICYPIIII